MQTQQPDQPLIAESADDLITELTNIDLALIGGGIANVHFC